MTDLPPTTREEREEWAAMAARTFAYVVGEAPEPDWFERDVDAAVVMRSLLADLDRAEERTKAAEYQWHAAEVARDEAEQDAATARAEREACEAEHAGLLRERTQLRAERDDARGHAADWQRKAEKLMREGIALQRANDQLRQERERVLEVDRELTRENDQLRAERDEAEKRANRYDRYNLQVVIERDEARTKLERAEAALRVLADDLEEGLPLRPPKTKHHERYAAHVAEARAYFATIPQAESITSDLRITDVPVIDLEGEPGLD